MMKKLIVLVFAALFATLVLAQEAPDVLVKRVTEEVLDIVRQDKNIQNGDSRKAIELVDAKVIPHFNLAQGVAAAAAATDCRVQDPAGAHLFQRAYQLQESEGHLQAVQNESWRQRCAGAHRGRSAG